MARAARHGLLAGVLLLCACATGREHADPHGELLAAASRSGMRLSVHATPAGPVRSFSRGLAGASHVDVYLEGDGRAWQSRRRVSRDPTPRHPLAQALALRDPAPAVLYLGRPCQYASAAELADCEPRYWTAERYGEAVVAALDGVLETLLSSADGAMPTLGLTGYSGGAAIAVLLAARRDDVAWVVSVAGNLDPAAWTAHHGVSALSGLDPVALAPRLADTPQAVLLGRDDRIVAPSLVARYLAVADAAAVEIIDDFDHRCCWVDAWPRLPCRVLHRLGADAPALCAAP